MLHMYFSSIGKLCNMKIAYIIFAWNMVHIRIQIFIDIAKIKGNIFDNGIMLQKTNVL